MTDGGLEPRLLQHFPGQLLGIDGSMQHPAKLPEQKNTDRENVRPRAMNLRESNEGKSSKKRKSPKISRPAASCADQLSRLTQAAQLSALPFSLE